MSSKQQKKAQVPAAVKHGRNDDDLDTNFKQSASYTHESDSGGGSDSDDNDAASKKKKSKKQKVKKESKKQAASDSDSGSDADFPMAPAAKKEAAPAVKKEAPAAPAAKIDTSLPPVRAPAVPQKLQKAAPGEAKQLTKQQINQIKAREKQKLEAEKKAREAAKGAAPAAAAAASSSSSSTKKKTEDKKRKAPASDSDSSSGSDSGSDSDSDAEPMSKAQKASAAATPAAAAAARLPGGGSDLVDTTGMSEKDAKAAIMAAKREARKLKAEKKRAQQEAAGVHPTQHDLQLMGRDLAAVRLWEMFAADRRERGKPLTAVESDEIGQLSGKSLAQLPGHDTLDGHSFKMLYKSLKSMYGANYQSEVCGGAIQPAMSTKQERLQMQRDRAGKKQAGDEEAEEEEKEEVKQKEELLNNPTIGAPYVVFVTCSAIRAVEIGRAFKKISTNTRVVKLFAKHIKMEQQREELSHDIRVVIGTPHRLLKLSQQGFLKWDRAHLILWDIGKTRKLMVAEMQEKRRMKNKIKAGVHVENPLVVNVRDDEKGKDRKMFTLLTLKDTKSQLWQLYEEFLSKVLVKKQTAKLVLL